VTKLEEQKVEQEAKEKAELSKGLKGFFSKVKDSITK